MEVRNSNGTFKPGHPGLKPKGSVSEFQKVTREKLGEFLKSKLSELSTIYESLSNRDKAKLLLAVAEFFLPKQREMVLDASVETTVPTIDYTKLSEGTLKEILAATTINENGTLH